MSYIMVFGYDDETATYFVTTDPVNATTSIETASRHDDMQIKSMWCSVKSIRTSEIYEEMREQVRSGGDFYHVLLCAAERIRMDMFDRVEKISDTTFNFSLAGEFAYAY